MVITILIRHQLIRRQLIMFQLILILFVIRIILKLGVELIVKHLDLIVKLLAIVIIQVIEVARLSQLLMFITIETQHLPRHLAKPLLIIGVVH